MESTIPLDTLLCYLYNHVIYPHLHQCSLLRDVLNSVVIACLFVQLIEYLATLLLQKPPKRWSSQTGTLHFVQLFLANYSYTLWFMSHRSISTSNVARKLLHCNGAFLRFHSIFL